MRWSCDAESPHATCKIEFRKRAALHRQIGVIACDAYLISKPNAETCINEDSFFLLTLMSCNCLAWRQIDATSHPNAAGDENMYIGMQLQLW